MTQTITKTTEDQITGGTFSDRKVKGSPSLIDVFARYKPNDSRRNHVDDVTGLTSESAVDAATKGKPVIGEITPTHCPSGSRARFAAPAVSIPNPFS
jgi:hypothetical protein